jgi:hypothetical protein
VDDRLAGWRWYLLDRHLDPMTAIADDLGDELLNVVPDLPGANSAYQVLIHCCGMLEWWTRHAVLGERVDRHRDAEFVASGDLASLHRRVDAVRAQVVADLARTDVDAAPIGALSGKDLGTPLAASAHGVLQHVLEELAQHHGHLEITRDLVTSASR